MKLPAKIEAIDSVTSALVKYLNEQGVEHSVVFKVQLALEEILANIASYAYAPEDGDMEIDYDIKEHTLVMTISDEGKPFNPLEKDDPDITLSVAERPIGGLGVFIVKNTMDDVQYYREDNKNILIIKKKIA